jgi:hypothetical protein
VKLLERSKDGGPESTVDAYWLFEVKRLCSVALLRFGAGSRDAYHSHAFHSASWVLRGRLREQLVDGRVRDYRPSLRPVLTLRSTFHRVFSYATSWVLTFRGPWSRTWREHDPRTGEDTTLTHGRRVVP